MAILGKRLRVGNRECSGLACHGSGQGCAAQKLFDEGFIFLIFLIVLYFAPAINAVLRKHKARTPITVLNAFLGWTFIGWVALIWS
ncbi:MAG TPA: superinfection immunity protein [Candidatus Binatia bacterium]|nr:superinfection immunity protein [Candidatus Binatia bacterium]